MISSTNSHFIKSNNSFPILFDFQSVGIMTVYLSIFFKKIKNPETGKMIKIKSALQYDKSSKAHKALEKM